MVHTAKNLQSFRKPERITIQDVLSIYEPMEFNGNMLKIATGSISPGVYLLQIADDSGKVTNFKFVVQ